MAKKESSVITVSTEEFKQERLKFLSNIKIAPLTTVSVVSFIGSIYTYLNNFKTLGIILMALFLVCFMLLVFVFNEKSVQLSKLAIILRKNQNNQFAAQELEDLIEPMDKGDFTHKVEIEDKFLYQIAQRIDKTRVTFAEIVRQVRSTSNKIIGSANATEDNSVRLLEVSSNQYDNLGQSIEKIGKITNEMDEVAQLTWIAKEESNKSQEAAKEGTTLVKESIAKMDEIRDSIQDSSKKIKKLGESAQAITEVTSLIQDVTKQINILALNVAIQAANLSGESGREFSVVAQEVQRLALNSEDATRKIESLIVQIQEDTASAVASMEKTTQEVVVGAKLTDNAGQALKKINELSVYVAEHVSQAAIKLEEKSGEMASIAVDMSKLQKISEQASDITKITADQVESLKSIAAELDSFISDYKVDE